MLTDPRVGTILGKALMVFALVSPALADDWQALVQVGIVQALSARVVQYDDGATQKFHADGRTVYAVSSGESWGKWWVEGALYCSIWPPSESRSCYSVETQGLEIRFVGSGGDMTVGRYIDL